LVTVFAGGEVIKQINMMSGAKVDFDKATQDAQERFFNVVGAPNPLPTLCLSSRVTGTPEQIQIAQQMISEKVSPRPGGSFGQATMGYNTLGANLSQPTTAYDQYAAYSAQVYQQQQSGGYGLQQQGYGQQQQQQQQGGAQTEGLITWTRCDSTSPSTEQRKQWEAYYAQLAQYQAYMAQSGQGN
jgi:hypothetical protein